MCVGVCFFGSVVFFRQCLHNNTQNVVGKVTLCQPVTKKDPQKNDPKTIKTQLHPENYDTRHKGHPKNIKFR